MVKLISISQALLIMKTAGGISVMERWILDIMQQFTRMEILIGF